MHNCVSVVNGKILHREDICCCGNNSLFFCYRSYIFAVFEEVFTFTAAILPAFGRQMCSVALLAVSAGACKCHAWWSVGCRAVLNINQGMEISFLFCAFAFVCTGNVVANALHCFAGGPRFNFRRGQSFVCGELHTVHSAMMNGLDFYLVGGEGKSRPRTLEMECYNPNGC